MGWVLRGSHSALGAPWKLDDYVGAYICQRQDAACACDYNGKRNSVRRFRAVRTDVAAKDSPRAYANLQTWTAKVRRECTTALVHGVFPLSATALCERPRNAFVSGVDLGVSHILKVRRYRLRFWFLFEMCEH